MESCIFCTKSGKGILFENDLAKAFYDSFPVSKGHTLIVPKRHVETFFDATPAELCAINELIFKVKNLIQQELNPDGYNIGVNVGEAGGQSIFHFHYHFIPRFSGDVENPRGGIRKIKYNIVHYPPESS